MSVAARELTRNLHTSMIEYPCRKLRMAHEPQVTTVIPWNDFLISQLLLYSITVALQNAVTHTNNITKQTPARNEPNKTTDTYCTVQQLSGYPSIGQISHKHDHMSSTQKMRTSL